MINTGSSVVPLSLIEAWHARGIPVGQVYGSTETCPIAIYLRAEDAMRKAGSAGRAAMHCEVDLVDGAGSAVAAGVTGEIRVRGPSVMRGYFGRPEATAAAIQDGWYRTGDLARQDEDGFFWVVGRSKDMIVSGGENIYPAELEAVLADSPRSPKPPSSASPTNAGERCRWPSSSDGRPIPSTRPASQHCSKVGLRATSDPSASSSSTTFRERRSGKYRRACWRLASASRQVQLTRDR
jgi:acyl-CoA synthetase (AMP-forming)/AMP-acid ligase II